MPGQDIVNEGRLYLEDADPNDPQDRDKIFGTLEPVNIITDPNNASQYIIISTGVDPVSNRPKTIRATITGSGTIVNWE